MTDFNNPISAIRAGGRTHWILLLVIILLVAALIGAICVAYWQYQETASLQKKAQQIYNAYLANPKGLAVAYQPVIAQLNSVRFCWTTHTCVVIPQLQARLQPVGRPQVFFDDPMAFTVHVQGGHVLVAPDKFAGMLNESVFNYPGSALKDLQVAIVSGRRLRITGNLHVLLWIPFEFIAHLAVDRKANVLVISVDDLHIFKFLPINWVIDFKPFNLEKLVPVPSNRYLTIQRNRFLIKPFGLFPPPRVTAQMQSVSVGSSAIELAFAGQPTIATPPKSIKVTGGPTAFTLLQMNPTHIVVTAQNAQHPFTFYLNAYRSLLPKSQLRLDGNQHITVTMPSAAIP